MKTKKHGLSIGIERVDNDLFLSLKAIGKLNHQDYEIITPMLESALAEIKQPKIKALIDGTELDGWEPRAAWDDFKIGLKHGNEFEKIAIYGNKNWLKLTAKIGSWFVSGEVEYFDNYESALSWVRT
jgi:hypothetical protein